MRSELDMADHLDPDLYRGASHTAMFAHLTGPFAAGAFESPVAIGADGRAAVTRSTREPLLLVMARATLGEERLRVAGKLDPDAADGGGELPTVTFDPFTEQGAALPLLRPPVDPRTRAAAAFTVALTATRVASDGTETPVAPADIAAAVQLGLIEGVTGRVAYLLGAEKQRIRRAARELSAMRALRLARDDALDRAGADLAVPRFAERLDFSGGQIVTATAREPDAEYRRRLVIYRPLLVPTTRRMAELLNGPGGAADPNRGLPGATGVAGRFTLEDADNEFAVAIHLVPSGGGAARANFLKYLRDALLVWPAADGNAAHDARFLPRATDDATRRLRQALAADFTFPADAAIAPALAAALGRVGRCRRALGDAAPWAVLRAQDDTAGSRYELGLGVDVEPLSAARLDAMVAALSEPNRPPVQPDPGAEDPAAERAAATETEQLLRAMTPRPAADDPEGAWLLGPCRLRTVHRVDTGRIYLSHLPTFGLTITEGAPDAGSTMLPLEARYNAPGDPGKHAVLAAGLTAALAAFVAGGDPAWANVADADSGSAWDRAQPLSPADPAGTILRAAGLTPIEQPPTPPPPLPDMVVDVVARLKRMPPELLQTIRLPDALSQRVFAGDVAAAEPLRRVVQALRDQHLSSVLPLAVQQPGGARGLLLVVSVTSLPEPALALGDRRASGFRWYVVPIQGPAGTIRAVGSRTAYIPPAGTGVAAVVALGYARRGLTDPYEFRVDLTPGANLTLSQYEFVMNLLDHAHPIGVEINTFNIRRAHVDLDRDGTADPLPPSLANTFRQYRRPSHRGQAGVTLDDGNNTTGGG